MGTSKGSIQALLTLEVTVSALAFLEVFIRMQQLIANAASKRYGELVAQENLLPPKDYFCGFDYAQTSGIILLLEIRTICALGRRVAVETAVNPI